MISTSRRGALALAALAGLTLAVVAPQPSPAEDRLLEEAVGFAGVIGFLGAGAPGFVIAAVRTARPPSPGSARR
jgi:serine-type D-Ala-D-Ala carboxypeptidase/endopeptidase